MKHVKPQNIAMCLLGIVFILSSVTKAIALPIFAGELQLYLDIYFGGWLRDYKLQLAGMVCMAELVIGIAYMIPTSRRYANVAAFLALTFFVYLTGDNYFSRFPPRPNRILRLFWGTYTFHALRLFTQILGALGIGVEIDEFGQEFATLTMAKYTTKSVI